jgi:MFS family permease
LLRTLSYFIGISSANHFSFMGARLVVVLYAIHLQASPAVVGLLAALFSIVSAFVSVPMGRVMDRVGPGRPMMWCSLAMVAGMFIGVLWRDIAALFLVSVLVGTAYSLFFVGHTQWVGRIGSPKDRVRNISWASMGFGVATLLGPLSTGYIIDHFGHREALLVLGAVPLITIAVLAFRVIESPPGAVHSAAARAAARKHRLADLLRDRDLRRVYLVSVMASSTWSIVSLLIPLYGVEIGLSASTIGWILGAYSFASIVIRIFMTQISRRFSSWQQMLMSLTASGVCFVILPLVSSVAGLVAVTFLIGLGMGMAGPLSQNLLYDASPPDRVGEVMGLRVTVMNATSTVVPLMSGAISAAVGVLPVFWLLGAMLVGGSYLRRAQWHQPRPVHEQQSKDGNQSYSHEIKIFNWLITSFSAKFKFLIWNFQHRGGNAALQGERVAQKPVGAIYNGACLNPRCWHPSLSWSLPRWPTWCCCWSCCCAASARRPA